MTAPTPTSAPADGVDRLREALDSRVDSQVWRAAEILSGERIQQPEWLWFDDSRTSFGRWSRNPRQAPYMRGDIVIAMLTKVLADHAAALAAVMAERDKLRAKLGCPIGMDGSRTFCSAGTCWACLADRCVWSRKQIEEAAAKHASSATAAIERAAKLCEARADYFDRAHGYRTWKDAARSYRQSAKEIRALSAQEAQP